MEAATPVEATMPTTLWVTGTERDSSRCGVWPWLSVPSRCWRSGERSQSVASAALQSWTARARRRRPGAAAGECWTESRVKGNAGGAGMGEIIEASRHEGTEARGHVGKGKKKTG